MTSASSDSESKPSDAQPDDIAQMRAVTVSRQYGSGGGEIASRLAQRLGWRLVDHEIVAHVANALGVPESDAEEYDERGDSMFARMLAGMRSYEPAIPVPGAAGLASDEQRYRKAMHDAVKAACEQGRTVIVGRGSQVLLASRRDVLHVRIVAPLEGRITYVMRREGLNRAQAKARIQMKDRDRYRYLAAAHHISPDDAQLYDLAVNTAVLDLDAAVDLIALALERKTQQLDKPEEALGPGAGAPPYPGRPADLRPPAESGPEPNDTPSSSEK
jgi:CMP/dCMP kinase